MAAPTSAYLAIDASTEQCSVALQYEGQQRIFRSSDTPRAHAQVLLTMVDEVIAESGVLLRDLEEIAVGAGPGSFTGVRIGMSIAQGLAFASQIPLVPVCSLEMLARALVDAEHDEDECSLVACLDARMGEIYWASYRWRDGGLQIEHEPRVSSPDAFNKATIAIGRAKAAGHGLALETVDTSCFFDTYPQCFPHAEQILTLRSDVDFSADQRHEGYVIEPIYLRNEVAWEKRRRIRDKTLI